MNFPNEVYIKWLLEDTSNPLKAVHFLWEYLHTPNENKNISIEDELYILEEFIKRKRKELNENL